MPIPVSKDILEPIITTNVQYVNSFEEFEKIELQPNQTELRFDNFKQCFYIKSRDKFGEYSPVLIFFYENFAQKIQNLEREEFIKKCKDVGLDELKTELKLTEEEIQNKENIIFQKEKVLKLLNSCKIEANAPSTFYDIHKVCRALKISAPKFDMVFDKLKEGGFIAVKTHYSPLGIKTNASNKELMDIIQELSE